MCIQLTGRQTSPLQPSLPHRGSIRSGDRQMQNAALALTLPEALPVAECFLRGTAFGSDDTLRPLTWQVAQIHSGTCGQVSASAKASLLH